MRVSAGGRRRFAGQTFLIFLCLLPLGQLAWRAMGAELGPDPPRELALVTGLWTLRLLLLTLCVTPLRILSGQAWLLAYRRTLGLCTLFYATLHFSVWMALLLGFRFTEITREIIERPYITVGFAAWLLLLPLGITSTRGWVHRLGRRWKHLHRLVYAIGTLGVLHFLWLSKDAFRPTVYILLLLLLLGFRLVRYAAQRRTLRNA